MNHKTFKHGRKVKFVRPILVRPCTKECAPEWKNELEAMMIKP